MSSLRRRLAAASAFAVATLGLLNLLGWWLRSPVLTGLSAHFVPMAATSAIGLIAFAAIIVLGSPKLERLIVLVPLALAAATLAGVFDDAPTRITRMSPATACTFLLLGLAVVSRLRVLSVAAGLGVCVVGIVVVLGYIHDQPIVTGTQILSISLPAGIGFAFLGAAWIATLGPEAPFLRHFFGPSVRARLLRAFVPASAGLVIAMRVVSRFAQVRHAGNPVWLFALLAVGCAAVMAAMVGLVSAQLAQKLEAAESAHLEAVAATIRAENLARETQLSKLAVVGNLISGIGHEINNPIGVVRSSLQFLEERLSALPNSAELAAACVDSILAADRICDVTRELQRCTPDAALNVYVNDVDGEIRRALDAVPVDVLHQVRVVRELAPTAAVSCDAQLFDRVVQTLVRNAAEATHRTGSVREIHVRLRQDGQVVRLEVDDNGDGVSAAVASRIFDPFLAIKPAGAGRGLSLAGCEALVRAAGGTVSIEALPRGGSRFSVSLPVVCSLGSQPAAQRLPAATPTALSRPARRGRVLVVDDERMVSNAIQRVLRRDHDVVCVDSGELALARITAGAGFDVILCDLMMPKMSGCELHGRVREVAPAQADQMIFFSGNPCNPATHAFLKSVSARQRMDKPWDAEQLRQVVSRRIQEVQPA